MPSETKTHPVAACDLLAWLQRVAADRDLAPCATRVAAALSDLFEQQGTAQITLDEVGHIARVSRRSLQPCLAGMRARGHLLVEREPGGVNRYRPGIPGAGV